ncbi:MAG TPA: transposase [Bacillales bacterium]|nr:transposase [Bacillales bacterium]
MCKKTRGVGLNVNHGESKEGWTQFFDKLKSRGHQSPKMIISPTARKPKRSWKNGRHYKCNKGVKCSLDLERRCRF